MHLGNELAFPRIFNGTRQQTANTEQNRGGVRGLGGVTQHLANCEDCEYRGHMRQLFPLGPMCELTRCRIGTIGSNRGRTSRGFIAGLSTMC